MILKENNFSFKAKKPGTQEWLRKGLQILVDGLTGLMGWTGLTRLSGLTGKLPRPGRLVGR